MHHPFVWYELMTPDADAARAFYTSVLGWENEIVGPAHHPYTLLKVQGALVAGIMPTPEEVAHLHRHGVWRGYVLVDDVEASVAHYTRHSGRLCRPLMDIEGFGRVAVVADAQGAVLILFKPLRAEAPPPLPLGTAGTFGWNELHANDGPSAMDFYETQFGWARTESMSMGDMGTYQMFSTGGPSVGGMMNRMPDTPGAFWLYYVNVADIEAAVSRVRQSGGKVLMGPHQVPGGPRIATCEDPQGALFALMQTDA